MDKILLTKEGLMKKILSLLAILSTTVLAQDYQYIKSLDFKALGGWASGGGNAVVCFLRAHAEQAVARVKDNKGQIPDDLIPSIVSIEMYDNFEARLPRGLQQEIPEIIEIKEGQPIKEWVLSLAQRFHRYVPAIGQNIYAGMHAIPDSNIRFYAGPVKQVNDISNVIGTVNRNKCVITTMAIQRNFNDFYNLYIDSRLFNHPKHSLQSKATLLLHEYFYTQGRKNNHEDSAATREIVGLAMTRHPNFTIDYAAFLARNLKFGFGVLSEDILPSRAYLAYTALIDMAIWRTIVEKKNFVKAFVDSKCLKGACDSFIRQWNDTFPLLHLTEEMTFLKIFEIYEVVRNTPSDYFFPPDLETEMSTLLYPQYVFYCDKIDHYKERVIKQVNALPGKFENKEHILQRVEAEFESLKKQVHFYFFGKGNYPREIRLLNIELEEEEILIKDHQKRWLNSEDFFVGLLFETVIP